MKLTILCLAFILSSCTTYQYFTLTAENISKNKENEFVSENDTLKVVYRFNGYQGPVRITVHNKTNEFLEIDWKKSALIFNDRATSYYSPNLHVNGTVTTDTANSGIVGASYTSAMHADIYASESVQYIPPRSYLDKGLVAIPVSFFKNHELDMQKKHIYTDKKGYSLRYTKLNFEKSKSPVLLRSYLSFRIGSAPAKEFSLEHRFYVSEIWQSISGPSYFPEELLNKPDRFYLNP